MTSPNDERRPDVSGSTAAPLASDAHTYDTERHLPAHHNPLPSLDGPDSAPGISEAAFAEVQASEEFAELRRRFRNFAFPMTAAFLLWYFGYVLASVYARDLMATPVFGNLNLGMCLGLLQFVTTFGITALYLRHMRTNIDPLATQLRERLEGPAR